MADIETFAPRKPRTAPAPSGRSPPTRSPSCRCGSLVLFPGMVIPVTLGRPRSVAAAQDAVRAERQIGVLAQRDASVDEPGEIDLYRIGTVANVVRYLTGKDGSHHVVSQGEQRFRVVEFLHGWPFLVARIERHRDAGRQLAADPGPLHQPQAPGAGGARAPAAGAAGDWSSRSTRSTMPARSPTSSPPIST